MRRAHFYRLLRNQKGSKMRIRRSDTVGVILDDIDIKNLTDLDYQKIEKIFHQELLVFIPSQSIDVVAFARLVSRLGTIANYSQCLWNQSGDRITTTRQDLNPFEFPLGSKEFPVQRVTGMKKSGQPTGIFGQGILDWHCNINGIFWNPGVALQAVEGVEGSSTVFLDTCLAFDDLSDDLKNRCRKVIARFEYSPEVWAEGMLDEQYRGMIAGKKRNYYLHPLVNRNKVGREGMYFHFLNRCTFPTDPELLEILKEHLFQEKYIQRINWRPGDIHLSHQVLTLHKREQNDPEILARRVLHRLTFTFSDSSLEEARSWWEKDENEVFQQG